RASDLRFTVSEARQFFSESLGIDLSDTDVALLTTRTEGWAVGLQMAGMSLNAQADRQHFIRSFAGDDRYIADYLVEEVLLHLPQAVQSFLLRTSILERLSGPLCDAVLAENANQRTDLAQPATPGNDHGAFSSQQLLEQLDHANLFIVPLDSRREWYCYHHLFADLLRQHLRQTIELHEVADLHRRAAIWFERHDQVLEAFDHAYATGDISFAAEILGRCAHLYFLRHELTNLAENVDRLPWHMITRQAMMCIAYGWATLAIGRPQDCERSIEAINQLTNASQATTLDKLQASQPNALMRNALLESWVMKAQTAITRRDFAGAQRLSEEVLPYLSNTHEPGAFNTLYNLHPVANYSLGLAYERLGNAHLAAPAFQQASEVSLQLQNWYLYPLAITHLAQTQVMRGQLHEAAATYAAMLHSTVAVQLDTPLFGATDVGLGNLSYEWNDLTAAKIHYEAGIERTKDWQSWEALLPAYSGLALLSRVHNDIPTALALLDELTGLCRNNAALVQPSIDAMRARLWITQGDLASVERWVKSCGLDSHGSIPFHREAEAIVLARVYGAQQQPDEALLIIDQLIAHASAGQHWKLVIEALNLKALLRAPDEQTEALRALGRAVQLGLAGHFIRTFVDEGEPLRELLRQLEPPDVPIQGYIQQLLDSFPPQTNAAGAPHTAKPVQAGLAEPLTERERDVLQLIAEGLSNQQIASRLYISPTTVKTHITNINSKLGAASRTHAVAIARTLGILRA
ncbi:MAG TPA: LuxR C-terminal-related transcriptional regulator, partial [Anaerolineae bacterium]